MEYTVFRNLKRHRLLKDLEEEYIHEKKRKYDNEAIENDFVQKQPPEMLYKERFFCKKFGKTHKKIPMPGSLF